MNFFNDIGKKLTQVGQGAVKGTKDLADITRINSSISEETKSINNLYLQLGKRFYEMRGENAEPEFSDYCSAIRSASERIEKYREEIAVIKGIKICPNCGADIPAASAFCGSCGYRSADVPPPGNNNAAVCSECGKPLNPGVAFCDGCGKKV